MNSFVIQKTFLAAGQASLTLYETAGSLFSLEFSGGYEARRLIADDYPLVEVTLREKTVCQQSNPISVGVMTKVVQFQVQKRRKVTIVNRRVCNLVRFTVSTRKDVQGMYLDAKYGRHTVPND